MATSSPQESKHAATRTPSLLLDITDDLLVHIAGFLTRNLGVIISQLWLPGLGLRLVRLAKSGALNDYLQGDSLLFSLQYFSEPLPKLASAIHLVLAAAEALAPTHPLHLYPLWVDPAIDGAKQRREFQRYCNLVLRHPAWVHTPLLRLQLMQCHLTVTTVSSLRSMHIQSLSVTGPYEFHSVKPLKGQNSYMAQQTMHEHVDALMLLLLGGHHDDAFAMHVTELELSGCQFTRAGREVLLMHHSKPFYPKLQRLEMRRSDGGSVITRMLLNPLATPALRKLEIVESNIGRALRCFSDTMGAEEGVPSDVQQTFCNLLRRGDVSNATGQEIDMRVILCNSLAVDRMTTLYAIEAAHGTAAEALYELDSRWLHRLEHVVMGTLPTDPDVRALENVALFPTMYVPSELNTISRVPLRSADNAFPHFPSARTLHVVLPQDISRARYSANLPVIYPGPAFPMLQLHTLNITRGEVVNLARVLLRVPGARQAVPALRHVVCMATARELGHELHNYNHACLLCVPYVNSWLSETAATLAQSSTEANLPVPQLHLCAVSGIELKTDRCTENGSWFFHNSVCDLDNHAPYVNETSYEAACAVAGDMFAWNQYANTDRGYRQCYGSLRRLWRLMSFPFVLHTVSLTKPPILGCGNASGRKASAILDEILEVPDKSDSFLAPLRMLGIAWLSSFHLTPLHEREAVAVRALAGVLTLHWSVSFPVVDGIANYDNVFSATTLIDRVRSLNHMVHRLWWRTQVVAIIDSMSYEFMKTGRIFGFYTPCNWEQGRPAHHISRSGFIAATRLAFGFMCRLLCGREANKVRLVRGVDPSCVVLPTPDDSGFVFEDPLLPKGHDVNVMANIHVYDTSFGHQILANVLEDFPASYEFRAAPAGGSQSQPVRPLEGRKRVAELQPTLL